MTTPLHPPSPPIMIYLVMNLTYPSESKLPIFRGLEEMPTCGTDVQKILDQVNGWMSELYCMRPDTKSKDLHWRKQKCFQLLF